ncbi:hypothetical protein [Stenotrophomonas sp. GZD-301]|uniref:hypothetical protein n=1 Tax=Stenotrophomonas sp. GZD-301 TaxID=3404814 RepID=UPI003BB639A7
MMIVLKDATGRRLRLGEGCLLEDGVLFHRRMMLVAVGDGLRLPPGVLDVINASVAGSVWLSADLQLHPAVRPLRWETLHAPT